MTDWPDDWFRESAGATPGAQPGHGPAPRPGSPGGFSAEPTQQLPYRSGGASAAGPPGGGWPSQPSARTARPAAPPATAGGDGYGYPGYGPQGYRRWLRPKRIAGILAVLLSIVIVGSVITYFYLDSKIARKNILVDYKGRPVQGAGTNWLITGSDSRQGLTRKEERKLATGRGIGGQRSDTIMVLHMPSNGGRPVLISLPRDSYVPIPGHGSDKINAARPWTALRRSASSGPGTTLRRRTCSGSRTSASS